MTASVAEALYSGIILGSIYAVMAMGLTLVYGALRVLNMAHGVLFTVGAYMTWWLSVALGLHPLLATALAAAVVAFIGAALYRGLMRPMLRNPSWSVNIYIATVGVLIVIENALLVVFGPRYKSLPPLVDGEVQVLGVLVSYQHMLIITVALGVLFVMGQYLGRSRLGLAITATSQNRVAAQLMGVNVDRVYLTVMAVSGGLAAIGGVLLSSFYFVSPTMGLTALLKALVVTIFGGLGSVKGTVVAAFAIGLTEAAVSLQYGVKWSLPVLFVVLAVVLLFRPNGLFGTPEGARL